MKKLLICSFTLLLVACSPVPDEINGKLLCLRGEGKGYMAKKHLGDGMVVDRVEFADSLCKEKT